MTQTNPRIKELKELLCYNEEMGLLTCKVKSAQNKYNFSLSHGV